MEREPEAAGRFRDAIRMYRADLDSISGLEPDELRTVRTAVREASARELPSPLRLGPTIRMAATLLIATGGTFDWVVTPPTIQPTAAHSGKILAEVTGLAFALAITTVPATVRRLTAWRARNPAPTASTPVPLKTRVRQAFGVPLAVLIAGGVGAGLAASMALIARDRLPGHVTVEYLALGMASGLLAATLFKLLLTMGLRYSSRGAPVRPFDFTLPVLLHCIAEMRRLEPVWDRPDVSRYLIHAVEDVAQVSTEQTLWMSRAPMSEPGSRAALRQPSETLARIVRAHKRPLATARSRAEYDKVVASLTAGLLAMASEDWKALFANAPAPRKPWLSTYALTHVLPAAVLGIAALVLPWVPPFHHSTLPTASIRVSLVAFAVLRLVPGPSLTDLVDKGLARGFDASKRG